MSRTRNMCLLMLAPVLSCAAGCFAVSQNPSYFPYWLPAGDFIPTHARPIGPSYYADFDPHAIDLAVEPAVLTAQVGSQVVVLATVRDANGTPRRSRRVEWMVTGGNLLEVDESGILPGRGGHDTKRGYSFTVGSEQRLARGNNNQADDLMLRPGQSWCVVSSPKEGDTHLQVVVPGIHNWDKRMKTVSIQWVDAAWEFPPPALAQSAAGHEFVTKIFRQSDREPLAKYQIRYTILDGPPAAFLPGQNQQQEVASDLNGLAKVRIVPLRPGVGVNRIRVEVIRPADPTTPTGSPVSLAKGETSVEWLVPGVRIGAPVPIPDIQLGPPVTRPDGTLGPPTPAPPPQIPPAPIPPPVLGRPLPQ